MLKTFIASYYDEICNCCRKNYGLCILERKLWIAQLCIQKIWMLFSFKQVRVILVEGILIWPFKLMTSNGHCNIQIAWKNYSKAIVQSYWSQQMSFWKVLNFRKDMAIWITMNAWWFFLIMCFFFFWPYFPRYQHFRATGVCLRPCWIGQKYFQKFPNQ